MPSPIANPWLLFLITHVHDGAGADGDELAHVNSFCRSTVPDDRPEEGENMVARASLRIPDLSFESKPAFEPGSVNKERRVIV